MLVGLSLVFAVSVFAALSCGAGQTAGTGGQDQPKASDASGEEKEQASSGEQIGHPALGSEDAPVTMTEYSDYQ